MRGRNHHIHLPRIFYLSTGFMYLEQLKELHSIAMQARNIIGKSEDEPRTNLRILPTGDIVVTLYSSCFSFIGNDFNHITFPLNELSDYVKKAKEELDILKNIADTSKYVPRSLKTKPYVIPYVVCACGIKRIYYFHLCKQHRTTVGEMKGHCNCYITWENLGD